MTQGQLQELIDLTERMNNVEVAVVIICVLGLLLFIGTFRVIAAGNAQTDNLEKAVSARVVADGKRVNALEDRIATLEARLKSFAALERLGIASQLGDEMLARTDEQVATLEHEMVEKIDQLRERQRRTLEEMRVEMEQYRANMAGITK